MTISLRGAGTATTKILNPSVIDDCALWMRAQSANVFTGGSRTLTAADKSCFVGTSKNTTRIAGVDFWLSAFINLTAVNTGNAQIVFMDFSGGTTRGMAVYELGGKIVCYLSDGTNYVSITSTSSIVAGVWTHVLFSADRDGNGVIYLNAASDKSSSIAAVVGSAITYASVYPTIGANTNLATQFFGGSIALIGYGEGYVPTAADVLALYNSGNGLTYAEVEARGGALATSLISNASRTGFYYNCNEQDPTAGLIDQAGSLDLTRTAAEMLTNTGFETRTGITGASFAAGDKAHLEAADAAALDLGTSKFVINANVLRSSTGAHGICGKYQDADNYWYVRFSTDHYLYLVARAGGTTILEFKASTTACTSTTTKYHTQVVIDRSNVANCKMYVNGTSQSFSTSTIADDTTSLDNTGAFTVGNAVSGSFLFDGRIAMLGIGKPADVTAAAVATAITNVAGTAGLGQYYGEQSSADKTALAWTAFWDLTEASGNRVDKVSSLTLAEVLTTNLVTNGTFDSDAANWTGANATGASVVGGVSGNGLEVTATSSGGLLYQSVPTVSGRAYTLSLYEKNGTAGGFYSVRNALGGSNVLADQYISNADWAQYTHNITATSATSFIYLGVNSSATKTTLFDTVSLKAASIPCASDADVFGGWTETKAGTTTVELETVSPLASSVTSARLRVDASDNYFYLKQAVCTTGHSYVYSIATKRSAAAAASIFVGTDGETNLTSHTLSTSETTFTGSFVADGASVTIKRNIAAGATIWIDTVSCKSAAIAVGNGPAEAMATDSSGNGYHGTFVGVSASGLVTNWKTDVPTPLAGAGGYAFQFDGVDDYVSLPATTGNNIASGTICAWVKCVSTSTGMIFVRQHDGVGTYAAFSIGRYIASDGNWTAGDAGKIYWHGKNGVAQAASTGTITAATWAHAAVVFSATSATMYINAAASGTTNGDYSIPNDAVCVASIAARYTSGAAQGFFSGQLDDVRIYNTALSAAQIAQLYSGTEATGATPVGHWSFDPPDGPFGIPSDGDPVWGWESGDASRTMMVNTTAGNRPLFEVTGINGYSALDFDGTTDYLRVEGVTHLTGTNPTVALVVKPQDVVLSTPATQAILAVQDEGSANNYVWWGLSNDGYMLVAGNNAGTTFSVKGSTPLNDNEDHLLVFQWDGSNWQLRLDGVAETETRAGTEVAPSDISNMDSTTLGATLINNAAGSWFTGMIADFDVQPEITDRELAKLEKHYLTRYAL